tara:strand:+ start:1435 stop:2367 length:933 start_codon:yes stop_codon:yes gene_type:complete
LKKKQKILSVQANALSSINIKTDTTLLLCSEAQKRGFKIFWYETKNLSIQNTRVFAKGYFVNFSNEKKVFYKIIKKTELDLSKSDYLLVRQNPPFNMDYVISTLYLEKIINSVKIINNPISIRNVSEKFYSTKFFRFMPPTIFTKNIQKIYTFYKKYKKVVLKPIDGYAGKEILFLNKKLNKSKINQYISRKGHVMVQKFLPQVEQGDKRVFIINGKVCGAIRRIPKKNSILSNLSQGGKAVSTKLNYKENRISKIIAKDLLKNKIYFAGIDFVGGYLIGDINVTSPTGLPQYKELTGINLAKVFWDNLL